MAPEFSIEIKAYEIATKILKLKLDVENPTTDEYSKEKNELMFNLAHQHVCYQCDLFPEICNECQTYKNGWQPKNVAAVRELIPEISGYWKRLEEENMKRLKLSKDEE